MARVFMLLSVVLIAYSTLTDAFVCPSDQCYDATDQYVSFLEFIPSRVDLATSDFCRNVARDIDECLAGGRNSQCPGETRRVLISSMAHMLCPGQYGDSGYAPIEGLLQSKCATPSLDRMRFIEAFSRCCDAMIGHQDTRTCRSVTTKVCVTQVSEHYCGSAFSKFYERLLESNGDECEDQEAVLDVLRKAIGAIN